MKMSNQELNPNNELVYECNEKTRIVFHFNKAHNTNPSEIPAWVVKVKGETFYVNHFNSKVGFSTKETPDSEHTKASIQLKGMIYILKMEDGTVEANIW
jgi:hypothetical protein